MTVEEVITKFSFKADTSKAEKFERVTNRMKNGLEKADDAWTNMNAKLARGFQSRWFNEFSQKVTDLRRVQLFFGGIRRGVEMISNVVPGMGRFSDMVTGLTQRYNKFTSTLINVRSALRSFGIMLGKTARGIIPMVKAEIRSLTTILKNGIVKLGNFIKNIDFGQIWIRMKQMFSKAVTAMTNGIKRITTAAKSGFSKLHNFLLNSNNSFLNRIGQNISRLQAKIAGMQGIRRIGMKIQQLTANIPVLGNLTKAFSAFGLGAAASIAMVVAGVVALVAAIKGLVNQVKQAAKDFIAFESGMKGVQRVTLASAEDMARLEEAALKAGEASVFGVKDAADAQRFLAMAGLETDEVIGALPGTLQLAAAAEMDLAMAADIATNIMSSNALAVEDLSRVNDILAFSASNSNQNVQQLGSAIQNIGPAGRLASLSVEDLSSWLSILANNGLRGEEAGTMVRNAIMDLVNPTDRMKDALSEAGVELSNFIDETGKIGDINALLMALQEMDEVSRTQFLGVLDARTYRALAPIITGNVEAMAEFNRELSQAEGTAERMADLAFQGLDGAIKEYKSKMETANVAFMKDSGLSQLFEEIVRIGTAVLPELWKTIGLALKPFISQLTIVVKVLRIIFTIVGGVLKIFNNVYRRLFEINDQALSPFMKALDQLADGARKIFEIFSNMESGPLRYFGRFFDDIGKMFKSLGEGLNDLLGPLLFFADIMLNLFLLILPAAWDSFFAKIRGDFEGGFFQNMGEELKGIMDFFNTVRGGRLSGDIRADVDQDVASTSATAFGGYSPGPAPETVVNNGGPSRNITVGNIEPTVVVEGGTTNEETAAAVSDAMHETLAQELRFLLEEVE